MTARTIHLPLTITQLERYGWNGGTELREALANAALGFTDAQFNLQPDEHPGFAAWDRLLDEVADEIGPDVRDLFYNALSRRLPWTWEAER